MSATAEQPCHDSSTSKCPRGNACSETTFRVSPYRTKPSQLITIRKKLAGFSMVRFLLKCIYGVCSQMPFGGDLCLTETRRLICNVNELTGFSIARVSIKLDFRKDIVVFS